MTAYQTIRDTVVDTVQTAAEDTPAQKSFWYKALNPHIDCTRFVKILPAETDDANLRCELREIPFEDRPTYEALSYAWGGGAKKHKIEVDGGSLEVGQNLFDALCFLRKRQCGGFYWIDALCINQDDVAERNRQLGIMGQIYFRSSMVILWLGVKYLKYQAKLSESQFKAADPIETTEVNISPESEDDEISTVELATHSEQQEMVKELCLDEYWKRVWIIQEIGQARRLNVCFGSFEIGWDDFIHLITMHQRDSGSGPMRLHSLRQERDHNGCPLEKLLHDHQEAECKDPKDKIYGLVGLAGDAYGFPMDYEKSLIQIWTDTMEFVNRRGLVQDTQLIAFGRLVKFLLMGTECDPWSQIARPSADENGQQSRLIDDSITPNRSKVFEIKGSAFGCIEYLGPSAAEIVADLSKERNWGESTQRLYQKQLGSAQHESRMLIRAILDASRDQVSKFCHNYVSSVIWKPSSGGTNAVDSYIKRNPPGQNNKTAAASSESDGGSDPYLYQLYNWFSREMPWKMGVASARAQRGDILCSINGVRKAVVVRVHRSKNGYQSSIKFQIYGTAKVTGHMVQSSEVGKDPFAQCGEDMALKMDARTLFVLLA